MAADRAGFSAPRIVFGLVVVAIGVLFLLDNLSLYDAERVLRFWPAALIALGLAMLAQTGRSSRLGGFVWILIGSVLLLGELDVLHVHVWAFWPAVLIFAGAALVWRALSPSGPRGGAADGSTVRAVAVMSGVERTSGSPAFRGGELTAVMGGCEIDLRRATIADSPAVIEVLAFWGGIELRIPETWTVDNQVLPFLGGVEDRTVPSPSGDQTLVLKGAVVMGGMEIRN